MKLRFWRGATILLVLFVVGIVGYHWLRSSEHACLRIDNLRPGEKVVIKYEGVDGPVYEGIAHWNYGHIMFAGLKQGDWRVVEGPEDLLSSSYPIHYYVSSRRLGQAIILFMPPCR